MSGGGDTLRVDYAPARAPARALSLDPHLVHQVSTKIREPYPSPCGPRRGPDELYRLLYRLATNESLSESRRKHPALLGSASLTWMTILNALSVSVRQSWKRSMEALGIEVTTTPEDSLRSIIWLLILPIASVERRYGVRSRNSRRYLKLEKFASGDVKNSRWMCVSENSRSDAS